MKKYTFLIAIAIVAVFMLTNINDKANSAIVSTTGININEITRWKSEAKPAENCIKMQMSATDSLITERALAQSGLCVEPEQTSTYDFSAINYKEVSPATSRAGDSNVTIFDNYKRITSVNKVYGDIFTGYIADGETGWMDGHQIFMSIRSSSEKENLYVFMTTKLRKEKRVGSDDEIKVKRVGQTLMVIDEPTDGIGVHMSQLELPPYHYLLGKKDYLLVKWASVKTAKKTKNAK